MMNQSTNINGTVTTGYLYGKILDTFPLKTGTREGDQDFDI